MVRLLGPVELRGEGGPVDPGPAERRAVLAALALANGRPLPWDRLADLVGAEPQEGGSFGVGEPAAVVRGHVGVLRRALGDRLLPGSRDCLLTLAPHELDVVEFRQLAARGRAAWEAGEAGRAEAELTAALRLWRGPVDAEVAAALRFAGAVVGGQLGDLEEERLRVFEDLTDARLDLGYAGELVPPLREHLAGHPLRERAWAQLMLALYRTGDLAAALSAYRQAQTGLRDRLGVEPGSELAGLHAAMLDRAPRLDPWARQPIRRSRAAGSCG